MGRLYETLTPDLIAWIERQRLFFAATAPGNAGHVNCSPKGLDTLRILDPLTVVYLDFTGSGVETIAHLRDNGRIVLMFCAFEGPPKILRVHGRGSVVRHGDPRFDELLQHFLPLEPPFLASVRSVIRVDVERIADSCGYGVPLMRYEGERRQLAEWTDNRLRKHGPEAIRQYQAEKNATSIDGLPGLDTAPQEMSTSLETGRLVLRRFTAADVDNLVDLDSDPEVMRYLNGGEPTPREVVESEILPRFLAYYQRSACYGWWAAVEKSTNSFVGWFSLHPVDKRPADIPELGYRLRKSAWGKGYATEGVVALICKAFTECGATRVQGTTYQDNIASRRVMEKAGMELVGTYRPTLEDLNATFTWASESQDVWEGDDVIYAIDKTDWEQR